MIRNPDFSDVSITYKYGKVVLPKNWDSFDKLNFPYFFSHPTKIPAQDFLRKQDDTKKNTGVLILYMLHQSNGFYTELKNTLKNEQPYHIEIELKIDRILLNSDNGPNSRQNGVKMDSADFDYNYIISLVSYFTLSDPYMLNKNERNYVIFDFPKSITPDSTNNWIKLTKTYIAQGNEEFYSIGTCNSQDYIDVLRTQNNDTTDYNHKWARCLLRKVSIIPVSYERDFTISDTFEPDSIILTNNQNLYFILRNVNFEFDSYELSESSILELKKIAEFLKNNSQIDLNIIGHTDTIGSNQYNQGLSEKRALSVYKYLINQGIDEERLGYEGKGESEPLDENLFIKNLYKNRRVVFEFKKE